MWAKSFLPFDLTRWETWVVLGAGAITASLTLLTSRFLFFRKKRRRTKEAPPREKAEADPFEEGSATEKRESLRREGNPVEVFITDAAEEGEPIRGWVIDRSLGGVRLLVYEPMDVGTILSIRPRQAPPGTPWTQIVVKSCDYTKSGYYFGCMFRRAPPWSIMLLFG